MSSDRENNSEETTLENEVGPSRKVQERDNADLDFALPCKNFVAEGSTNKTREMRRNETSLLLPGLVAERKQDNSVLLEKELAASTEQFHVGTEKSDLQQSVAEATVNEKEDDKPDDVTSKGDQGTVKEKEKYVYVTATSLHQDGRRVAGREKRTRMEEAISLFPEYFPKGLTSYSLEKPIVVNTRMKRDIKSGPVDSGYDEVGRWLHLFGLRADVAASLHD